MPWLLEITLGVLLACFTYLCGTALAMTLIGAPPRQFSMGVGPALLAKRFNGTLFVFRPILVAGFLRTTTKRWEAAPVWGRLLVALSGVALLMGVSALVLGWRAMTATLGETWLIAMTGVVSINKTALPAIHRAASAAESLGPAEVLAYTFAAVVGVNLLPMASHATGTAILFLLTPESSVRRTVIDAISTLVFLALTAFWFVALLMYIFR